MREVNEYSPRMFVFKVWKVSRLLSIVERNIPYHGYLRWSRTMVYYMISFIILSRLSCSCATRVQRQ
jgi:hypothetical protein